MNPDVKPPTSAEIRASIQRSPYSVQPSDVGARPLGGSRHVLRAVLLFADALVLLPFGWVSFALFGERSVGAQVFGVFVWALAVAVGGYGAIVAGGSSIPRLRTALWLGHLVIVAVVSFSLF